MKVIFDHAAQENATVISYYFKPETRLHFTAGQYVELSLKHAHPDERGGSRWFTLSSSPNDELLRITTRHTIQKSSSYKRAMKRMKPGAQLVMSEAMGDFVLPKLIQTPVVFIAGGIGITPIVSILSWITDTKEARVVKLVQAVRTEEDIIFQDVFDRAGLHATVVVSQPSSFWGGERGTLDAEMVLGLEQPDKQTLFYISGPDSMTQAIGSDLIKRGIPRQHIVSDVFDGYTGL